MNTLSARLNNHDSYPIPHADFLRLQHAHSVGVTVLDMLDVIECSGNRRTAPTVTRWRPWWRCLPTSWAKWSAPANPSCSAIWRSPVTTNNFNNQSCLPVEVRTAVYRRAVAQGYLSACEHYGLDVSASLDEVQMTIALELEGYYVRKYGPENGMDMACTMLSEMVQPDVLVAAPRLTRMGETMMDELLCGRLAASKATLH